MPVLITPSYANKLAHDRVVAIRSSHASTRSLVHRRPAGCVAFQRTHHFLSPVSFPAETSRRNRLTVFSSPLITTLLTTRPRHLVWTTLNEPHVCFHLPFFFSFFFFFYCFKWKDPRLRFDAPFGFRSPLFHSFSFEIKIICNIWRKEK